MKSVPLIICYGCKVAHMKIFLMENIVQILKLYIIFQGHPARLSGLRAFLEYVRDLQKSGSVWVATREEIATVWKDQFPCEEKTSVAMGRD